MKKVLLLAAVFISALCFGQSTTLVISQVYTNTGNPSGSSYNSSYVELHNVSGTAKSLNGLSIQYATCQSSNWGSPFPVLPNVSIPAGGYYLIKINSTGSNGAPLPTPDYIPGPGPFMGDICGRVALVNGTMQLTGCPAASQIIDLVSYGASENCFEGAGSAPAPGATLALFRSNNGCTDTNNNSFDLSVAAPAPRNSSSPAFSCAAAPALSASPLIPFGPVCIGTSVGPNSFTITGSNLNAGVVSVAPLTGYTYSTAAGGPYTASLSLMQPGGSYSQIIYVKFMPSATQSYDGSISVSGGGSNTSVPASGSGINNLPAVTTGTSSAITGNSATLSGTITAAGCTAVTAYGIIYSTVSGFTTGTTVAGSNLSGGGFSVNITGLTSITVYYFKAYATNAGGTTYGTQQSFTTLAPAPALSATSLAPFGSVCVGTTAGPNLFTLTGSNLTAGAITVGSLAGYTFSTLSAGPYTSSLTLGTFGGSYSQVVYVQFMPTLTQSYNGNIPVTGPGSNTSVPASGTGINTPAAVITGGATFITATGAALSGTITSAGCNGVSTYGIMYNTVSGFTTGTTIPGSPLSGGSFLVNATSLTPGTVYYFKAYVLNGGGTSYGTQQSFTTLAAPAPVLTATSLAPFGAVCVGTTEGPHSFTITGSNVTPGVIDVPSLAGYTYSTTAGGTFTSSLSLSQPGGAYSQIIYVQFTPTAEQSYDGNILIAGGGSFTIVPLSGSGLNRRSGIVTLGATQITDHGANLSGGILANTGCPAFILESGVMFSSAPNFTIAVVLISGSGSNDINVNAESLSPNTTFYYKAYIKTAGGTIYGEVKQFKTLKKAPAPSMVIYPSPIQRSSPFKIKFDNVVPGEYNLRIYVFGMAWVAHEEKITLTTSSQTIEFQLKTNRNIAYGMHVAVLYKEDFKKPIVTYKVEIAN